MSKKIDKPTKPKQPTDEQVEAFVAGGAGVDTEPSVSGSTASRKAKKFTRMTVDLPDDEHMAFKVACARTRRKMVDEIRAFVTKRTAELEQAAG